MATIRASLCSLILVSLVVLTPAALAQWVEFVEDSSRLDAAPSVGASDVREKDYAWGDVDKDGDIDLVVVRKQPFTSPGKDTNRLFMNVNGTLRDRTEEFASSSSVAGDNGFLTPTNDRDVVLVDVDLDGWLDMITAVTISDSDPKHIGHPRIYMNLCCAVGGCAATSCDEEDWLGFHYDELRIPQMLSYSGSNNFNPRFCSVSAGDVTGDGYPDLWFGDYDSSGVGGGNNQPPGADFNDKYLINQGDSNPGFFTDVTQDPGRLDGTVPGVSGPDPPFEVSAFGAANAIRDMNGDQINDIVKQTSLTPPQYVGIAFNEGEAPDQGFFDTYDAMTAPAAPYFVSVSDLNNDDKLDLVITDDGADRYLLNQGGGFVPDWISYLFSFIHIGPDGPSDSDDGFGSNSVIEDLDNDGWNDVLIADVDVDIGGCNRRLHIYKNLGGSPGDQITLQEQTSGSGCNLGNQSSCIVAGIPTNLLTGMHDMAVFDIDGDGWKDLVLGRCVGTKIFMNVPPAGPSGAVDQYDDSAQLKLGRAAGGDITLDWGASCSLDDTDYAIYAGRIIVPFEEHTQVVCSTGGATSQTITPGVDSLYYLVVPNNQVLEGSYGQNSEPDFRGQGVSSCFPQLLGACEE